jgi:predicted Zn finger-like uncharacterized protein
MSNVRLRRLQADHQNLVDYVRHHPRLRLIQAIGDPPEQYQIEYRIKSLRQVGDDLQPAKSHLVEISLPRNYPRTPPLCRMLTPVFHPNIAPHAICVGDHWSAGEPLKSIVARIGEMLAYQSYNVKSPLNGEAARWVEENVDELPLDKVSMLVEETSPAVSHEENRLVPGEESRPAVEPNAETHDSTPAAQPAEVRRVSTTAGAIPETPSKGEAMEVVFEEEPAKPQMMRIACPSCSTEFRVASNILGKKARCNRCQTVFPITEELVRP